MKLKAILLFVVIAAVFLNCNNATENTAAVTPGNTVNSYASAIYYGGDIVTMEGDTAVYAEAVAIKDGKIAFVGTRVDAEKLKGDSTVMNDLQGKTLLPGFVDGHGHFSEVGMMNFVANLLSPPDGPVKNIPQIQQILHDYMATAPMVKNHHIVIGLNYDDSQLEEKRHPTRQELDAVSTELPIMVVHQTGHFCTLNSKALEMVGLNAGSKNPAGGVIRREKDGKTPNGVLEEVAFFGAMVKLLPQFTPDEVNAQVKASLQNYISNGFTTVQEGKTSAANLKILPELADKGFFPVDIVSYPDIAMTGDAPALHGPLMSKNYTHHFRIGGVKVSLDGSPQGKTGWFSEPYFKVPTGLPKTYAGYPVFTDSALSVWFSLAYKNKWQMLAHCSGDAAIDQLIRIAKVTAAAYPGTDRRTVLVHGHFLRADQVPQIKALGIFPSLFPLHTFNWGDYHRQSVVGPKRAENIAPTGWMLENGMKFSVHHDAPVIFPKSMPLIASAVNRTTRTGYVLGPKHRVSPYVALEAMTIWPAYQHFEENTKGSIKAGKRADFVILDKNPIKIDPKTINAIKVMETIKEGKQVYKLGQP